MAKNTTSIIDDGFKATFQRIKSDTKVWIDALDKARNKQYPNRYDLVRIYYEHSYDNHLNAVIDQRIQAVLSSDFEMIDKSNNFIEKETEIINSDWFFKLIKIRMEAVFFGSKLIEVSEVFNNIVIFSEIPQENYIPETGIVTKFAGAYDGTSIESEPFAKFLLPIYDNKLENLGIVAKAIPMLIYKKNALIYWQSYIQTFGTPHRVLESDLTDPIQKSKLETDLKNTGNKAFVILPSGVKMSLLSDNGKNDVWQLYYQNIDLMNKECSKLILGTTMTVDNGSSRSQSEVHQNVVNMYAESDKRSVQFWVNDTLKPFLANLGIKLNGNFKFKDDGLAEKKDQSILNLETANILDVLGRNGFKPSAEWVTQQTGIPLQQEEPSPNLEVQKKKLIP